MDWEEFEEIYWKLEKFEYPHKDKLLEFIKYFFLDHVRDANTLIMNFKAFKECLESKRVLSDRTRNDDPTFKSRKKSSDS